MKSGTIYTLSISETLKNKFHIVAYLKEKGEFVSFETNKFKYDNHILLDIGANSKIRYKETHIENEIEVGNDIVLKNQKSKDELIEFLKEEKVNFSSFKRNRSEKFSIVEVKVIEDITVSYNNNSVDSHVIAIINGHKERIKVKDFRWINYWKFIAVKKNQDRLNEKIEHYIKFLNSRNIYFLLYRFKKETNSSNRFKNDRDIYWISGIFYV